MHHCQTTKWNVQHVARYSELIVDLIYLINMLRSLLLVVVWLCTWIGMQETQQLLFKLTLVVDVEFVANLPNLQVPWNYVNYPIRNSYSVIQFLEGVREIMHNFSIFIFAISQILASGYPVAKEDWNIASGYPVAKIRLKQSIFGRTPCIMIWSVWLLIKIRIFK